MPDAGSFSNHARPLAIVVGDVAAVLARAGMEDGRREARWLVGAALDLPPERFVSDPDLVILPDQLTRLAGWVARRAAREPLWRIAGERSFYGRTFKLCPATLEPRPDSEILIDAVLELVRTHYSDGKPLRILDVGTGTGCLLITLLAEIPNASGMGTDISNAALVTARQNAERLGVASRTRWKLTRSLESVTDRFDILVTNPPYIPSDEIEGLQPEVRLHDPIAALDGGPDGLEIYREIAAGIADVVPTGIWALEVGAGQHDVVAGILSSATADNTTLETKYFRDFSGYERCVALLAQRVGSR
jgi:release factor glutamine methyltransferase